MTSISLVETVSRVLAIQRAVGADLALTGELLKECPPAATVLASIEAELDGLPVDLESGLLRLGAGTGTTSESRQPGSGASAPSSLLEFLYGRLNEAALACAGLHAIAHRVFDSSGEGNLADLAEGHSLAYLTAAAALSEVVSDVAIWGMEQVEEECQCRCPSCGIGICICARHGKETVAKLRQAAAVRSTEEGIAVRQPRSGSPAALAGLRPGSVIVAAVGQSVAGPLDLQRAIRDTAPEADIKLTISLGGPVTSEVVLRRL